MPNPYGSSDTLPVPPGGIDDGDSLQLSGFTKSGNAWLPRIRGGRYVVSGESDFRYLYAAPESVSLSASPGRHDVGFTLPSSLVSPESFGEAPVTLTRGSVVYTPVVNATHWAQSVPSGSVCLAEDLLDPSYLTGSLTGGSLLWYLPTQGAEVLCVHRSWNPRSFDVLADGDALLSEVPFPDELIDDRCFCHDRHSGLVYGLFPSEPLPPPPYGSGQWAQTYVSLASPSDTGDPLLCQEVTFIDTDGAVRVRHTNAVSPSAFFCSPDGPIPLTAGVVGGNVVSIQAPDPSQGGALRSLDYGSTVVVSYYVPDSFCLESLVVSGSVLAASLGYLSSASGSLTLTYESSPRSTLTASSPNLNPLTSQVSSGFLYLEDPLDPVPVSASAVGTLSLSTHCPIYDLSYSTGEVVVVRGTALDSAGVEISGAPLALSVSAGYAVTRTSPTTGISASDATVLFFLTPTGAVSGPITVSLSDTRTGVLTTASFLQAQTGGPVELWEPSVYISLAETYRYVGSGESAIARRIVKAFAVGADGFPWLQTQNPGGDPRVQQPGVLVLSSDRSAFHNPTAGGDLSLGPVVRVTLGQSDDLLSPSGVLSVGYTPVPGDTLRASLFIGDFRYDSDPVSV